MLARQEWWQHPDLARYGLRTLPPRHPQRADRPRRDGRRALIAAPNRAQFGVHLLALAGGDDQPVGARLSACTRRPCVADLAVEAASSVVVDQQARRHRLAEAGRTAP